MKQERNAIKQKHLGNKKYFLKIKNVNIAVKTFVKDWKKKLRRSFRK